MPRVLIIDDEDAVRNAMRILLEEQGFDVALAENGRAGLSAAEHAAFDAVIADILMPDMDGLQTIAAIHRLRPRVPVIAVSGAMDLFAYRDQDEPPPDLLALASEMGAIVAMQKPFRPEDLVRTLRRAIAGAALIDCVPA